MAVARTTDGEDAKAGWTIALTLPRDTWRAIEGVMPKLDWPEPTWDEVRPGLREGTVTLAGDFVPTRCRVVDRQGQELGSDQVLRAGCTSEG